MNVEFLYLGIGLVVFLISGFSLITYLEKSKTKKEL